ncbi:MAG: cytochrome c oxidase subunit II [Micavibrio sp.]|nr:MAG: cytochrome c oxidase subunit II [Micavibrio sp.]
MVKIRLFSVFRALCLVAVAVAVLPQAAWAAGVENLARPWQLGLSEPASPSMEKIVSFHNMMMYIITAIVAIVTGLLLYVMIRFNKKANPTPSKTSHNVKLEVIWTLIPVLILAVIVVPSMRLLYFVDRIEEADMTIKAIGYQWYWTYEYPDHGGFMFDAVMIPDDELKPGQHRLLDTYNPVVLPTDTNIRVLITAGDVLHAWAVPALGVKKDAVPGQINETWFRINRPGWYYGQCSELCGDGHAFMPIAIKAVTPEEFEKWVEEAKMEFGMIEYRRPQQEGGIEFAQIDLIQAAGGEE